MRSTGVQFLMLINSIALLKMKKSQRRKLISSAIKPLTQCRYEKKRIITNAPKRFKQRAAGYCTVFNDQSTSLSEIKRPSCICMAVFNL
jgi:hypothetical protein